MKAKELKELKLKSNVLANDEVVVEQNGVKNSIKAYAYLLQDSTHFKGWFVSGQELAQIYPVCTPGDYAYVGTLLNQSTVYRCATANTWENTNEAVTLPEIDLVPLTTRLTAVESGVAENTAKIGELSEYMNRAKVNELNRSNADSEFRYMGVSYPVLSFAVQVLGDVTLKCSDYTLYRPVLKVYYADGEIYDSGWKSADFVYSITKSVSKIEIMIRKTDYSTISMDALDTVSLVSDSMFGKIITRDDLKNYTKNEYLTEDLLSKAVYTPASLVKADGKIYKTGNEWGIYTCLNNYYNRLNLKINSDSSTIIAIAFYSVDVNKVSNYSDYFIAEKSVTAIIGANDYQNIEVPENCISFIVSNRISNLPYPVIKSVSIISDIDIVKNKTKEIETICNPLKDLKVNELNRANADFEYRYMEVSHPTLSFAVQVLGDVTLKCSDYGLYRVVLKVYYIDGEIFDSGWKSADFTYSITKSVSRIEIMIRKTDYSTIPFDALDTVSLISESMFNRIITKNDLKNYTKKIEINKLLPATNLFTMKKTYIHHMFLTPNTASEINMVIPSQSIDDISAAKRLGFDMMEINLQTTSDGVFVVTHGVNGTLGYDFEDANGNLVNNVKYTDKTLAELKSYRFRSKYSRFKSKIPTLEEFLKECRRQGINLYINTYNVDIIAVRKILSRILGNSVAYVDSTSRDFPRTDGLFTVPYGAADWNNLTNDITQFGIAFAPMFDNAALKAFIADGTLSAKIDYIHSLGRMVGFPDVYETEINNQIAYEAGMDFSVTGYRVNDFTEGNLVKSYDISDWTLSGSDYTLTSTKKVLLGKGVIHIRFKGTIRVTMGKVNIDITSDGSQCKWVSSVFLDEIPSAKITINASTEIYSVDCHLSEV